MSVKKILLLLLLQIAFTGLLLGVGEFWFRQHSTRVVQAALTDHQQIESDPEYLIRYTDRGRRLRPNSHVKILHHQSSGLDIDMNINSLGFRGPEIVIPKPSDAYRILFLGDSITWEDYLPLKDTFVQGVEDRLQPMYAKRRIEAINAGIGDVGTHEEIDLLEEVGIKTQPDLVVLCFYLNDARPPWGFPQELGHAGWLRRHSALYDQLYRKLALAQWIHRQGEDRFRWIHLQNQLPWKTDRKAFLALAQSARYDWGSAWDKEAWETIEQQLQRLARLQKKFHFKVLIVTFPVAHQVYAYFDEHFPQWAIQQLAQAHRFDHLDLLPLLRSFNKELLFFDQCHPRAKTNALIARQIGAFIQSHYL